MRFLESDIREFQKLYKKYFDVATSKEDAYKQLSEFVHMMELVYQPISQEQIKPFKVNYSQKGDKMDYNDLRSHCQ